MSKRSYSPEFKVQVVLEALQSDGTDAELARAYHIHPVTLSKWKIKLKENGSTAFGGDDYLKEKQDKIAKLERMVGQKEVEIALLNWARADHHLESPPVGSV
ncbi:transposase [Salinibacter ruber]|uniref:transposase n=1 Tax=Salinibacter ruber TaxID=146919 RepID=UPI002169DF5A|nr:transposase [Salinibacter ruber]MCS4142423.1 transposase-like protein [Salinibacter ruber]